MDKDEAIQQFMELTSADNNVAIFFLESAKWDIEAAILSFYANEVDEQEHDERDDIDLDAETNESLQDRGLNNLNVAVSQNPKSSKSDGKIKTLSSLRNNDSEEEDEDRGQAFYVGGSERGGGQQVLGPPKNNKKAQNMSKIQDLFKSAQTHGAEVITDAYPESGPSGSTGIFSGSGYRLGDESNKETKTTRQSATNYAPVKVNVKIWSNGFSIDDGPLRSLTDPADVAFLQSLSTGQIPTELLQQHKFAKIDLSMEDRSSDEYKVPPKPKVIPFQGMGQMLGSPVPKIVDNSTTISQLKDTVSPIQVDEAQPVTQLQIRLANNSRLVVRMNHSHTVGDVRQHIIRQNPQYQTVNFQLMTTFPNKILSDDTISLQDANLLNAVIVQRLV